MQAREEFVWEGTPSQVVNLPYFIGMGLLFFLVVPLFLILWRWLQTKNTHYRLSTQRLTTTEGVLNKTTDDLELYRVKDYRVERPFILRLFNLGDVRLNTSDRSDPVVLVRAVEDAEILREHIRTHVENARERKGVRELDFE